MPRAKRLTVVYFQMKPTQAPHVPFSPDLLSQAVIFDVDGVLVDSYHAHCESWRALARETGAEFTESQFAATFGRTSRDILRLHWDHLPLTDDLIARLDDRKEAIYREIVAAVFPIMDGAVEVIEQLHRAGFRLAFGSSGPAENVELAIERLGVREKIMAIVTGRDVRRGKPDPEVFLRAAERLQVEPRRCVVIEDAPAGIAAAHAAGMAAIALLSRGRAAADFQAEKPELMVGSLREITPSTVQRLLRTNVADRLG
jgi:beta-phosphoglucomutase